MRDEEKLKLELERRRLLFDFWDREIRDSSNQNLSWSIGLVVGFLALIQILINMEKMSKAKLWFIVIVAVIFAVFFLDSNYRHYNLQKDRTKHMKIQAKKMDDIYIELLKER